MPVCANYEPLAFLKAALCLCSCVYAICWTLQFYRFPVQSIHSLHRIIAIYLWWRVFADGVSLMLLVSCPFTGTYAIVLKTAGEVTFALDNTLAYFVVLLIAWGFGVSRPHLYRQEVIQLVAVLVFAFISFLIYMLNPKSLLLVIMLVIGILLCISVRITIDSMKRLEAMYQAFRDHYWSRWLPVIEEKWELYGKFYYWEVVFYASQLFSFAGLHVYLQLVESTAMSLYISIDIVESIIESVAIFYICFLVRARPPQKSLNFQWEESDDWDIPVYYPLEDRKIADLGGDSVPVLVITPINSKPTFRQNYYFLGVPDVSETLI